MRRAFASLCAAVIAVVFLGPAVAASSPCSSLPSAERVKCQSSAPGDEYFGRLKLSFLGIMNTFRDEGIRAGSRTTDRGLIARVSFAEDALLAWASKYPHDPALAQSYYLAATVFKKISTQSSQQKARHYTSVLAKYYAGTSFGKQAQRELAVAPTHRASSARSTQAIASRNNTKANTKVIVEHHKR